MKRLLLATAGLAAIAASIVIAVQRPAHWQADNHCPLGCIVTPAVNAPNVITQNTRPPWVVAIPHKSVSTSSSSQPRKHAPTTTQEPLR